MPPAGANDSTSGRRTLTVFSVGCATLPVYSQGCMLGSGVSGLLGLILNPFRTRRPPQPELFFACGNQSPIKRSSTLGHRFLLGAVLRIKDPRVLLADLAATQGAHLRRFLVARVRNVAEVPDIVQEVYLRMLRIPNIESIRSPEAYLFTVAQHVVQQHILRATATPPSIELSQLLDIPSVTPDVDPVLATDAAQCVEQLQGAMDELSPKVRATFLLHRRDGLSLDEIGIRLGISRPMVKKNLMTALLHFRQRLEQLQ